MEVSLSIYLDHDATTPVDTRMFEAMRRCSSESFGNAASRGHGFGWEAEAAVDRACVRVGAILTETTTQKDDQQEEGFQMPLNYRTDKASRSPETPIVHHPHGTGQYWASRQWYYDLAFGLRKVISADQSVPAKPAGQRFTNSKRPDCAKIVEPDPAVCDALIDGKMINGSLFQYKNKEARIRPIARRLLEVMWLASGRSVSIASISKQLWGRPKPPTDNTLRTTVHRANIALVMAQCPLRLKVCRDQICFARIPLTNINHIDLP